MTIVISFHFIMYRWYLLINKYPQLNTEIRSIFVYSLYIYIDTHHPRSRHGVKNTLPHFLSLGHYHLAVIDRFYLRCIQVYFYLLVVDLPLSHVHYTVYNVHYVAYDVHCMSYRELHCGIY